MIAAWAIRCWRRLRLTRPRYAKVRWLDTVGDIPTRMNARSVYVVSQSDSPKWAAFECPCGRGHRITLTTQRSHEPHWTLTFNADGASLRPSIDRIDGRVRCHFFLKAGRVTWA